MEHHAQRVHDVLAALADFAANLHIERVEEETQEALDRTLLDSFGVALAGARTPEFGALVGSWPAQTGPSSVWGTTLSTDPHTATLLVGTALCSLELDEGNKIARGHPGAHVIPAAIAEAQRLGSSGTELRAAILAGYEVAARMAYAFSPTEGLHPHGHWGALGAAVAVGKLHGFHGRQLLEAMDSASALALATPFSSALDGSYVRNTWVGIAGTNGITAVRLVAAGLGSFKATAAETFGKLLGSLDIERINSDPHQPFAITEGYFKRHSSCAYTHPPADAAISLSTQLPGGSTASIRAIRVKTHGLAAPLDRAQPATRLAAMFSIPHVVAVSLRDGVVAPQSFDGNSLRDPELARLRSLTTVERDEEFHSALPHQRRARVVVTLADGKILDAEVPNAIGDSDYFPLSSSDITHKITGLVGETATRAITNAVGSLRTTADVRESLRALAEITATR